MAKAFRYLIPVVLFATGAYLLTRATGPNPALGYFLAAVFFGMAIAAFQWARSDDGRRPR